MDTYTRTHTFHIISIFSILRYNLDVKSSNWGILDGILPKTIEIDKKIQEIRKIFEKFSYHA